jgi:23S rRNA pseudouridine1911/1915/1917 synthase
MRHRLCAAEAGRLDKLLADGTPLSRARARALISRGGVRVDGVVQSFPAFVVPAGAWVEVRTGAAPTDKAATALPEVWRDAGALVIDKPCGLPTQPTREGHALHVHGILAARERYVGLHHRLDTPASGLLLVTVERGANAAIAAAFQQGRVERVYAVVVVGDPGPEGVWDAPIDGQPARTRFTREGSAGGLSVLRVTLETGRTHQIRLHAAGAGFPVVGDRRHGGAAGRLWPRLALHAFELAFPHPRTGARVEVSAPIPEDLAPLIERAGVPLDDDGDDALDTDDDGDGGGPDDGDDDRLG